GYGLLAAHHGCIDEAAHQHHERQHDVHDPDLLVIEARYPIEQDEAPCAEICDDGNDRNSTKHGGRRARGSGGAVERKCFDRYRSAHVHFSAICLFRSGGHWSVMSGASITPFRNDLVEQVRLDSRIVSHWNFHAWLCELLISRRIEGIQRSFYLRDPGIDIVSGAGGNGARLLVGKTSRSVLVIAAPEVAGLIGEKMELGLHAGHGVDLPSQPWNDERVQHRVRRNSDGERPA